jgi:group I intron endonuclease
MLINTIVGPYGNCMIIYKTTNLINGKFYVGQDSKNNPEYYGSGTIFKLALKKYGKENFQKEIVEYCSTQEELNEREKYWIKETKAIELGYNLAQGGFGVSNMSDEIKKKISKSKKGKKLILTDEQRLQYSLRMKNRKISDETRKKLSKANKGKKLSQEHRKKLSESHKGIKLTEEQKRKIGEKSRGRKHTEEAKRKIGEKSRSRKHTEETKKLIGEKGRGRKLSQEHRQALLNAIKGNQWNRGRIHTQETREKRRITSTGRIHSEETRKKLSEIQTNQKKVCMINPETKEVIKIFSSIYYASKETGINRSNISTCLNKKCSHKNHVRKTAGGYKWKFYVEE